MLFPYLIYCCYIYIFLKKNIDITANNQILKHSPDLYFAFTIFFLGFGFSRFGTVTNGCFRKYLSSKKGII
ncbi:hypothetical protein SPHINGO8BC_90613 [Sphingobacterium multivorum]|uniref:Uncharacterized protein n=1 Tax=Sphingobacterium multivorum TaxID=28454 RepID=A0A654DSM6_SPHMU|nr:hypothetical protein SPHINGO8BC_90613 [Sphingobacterium multivorum]